MFASTLAQCLHFLYIFSCEKYVQNKATVSAVDLCLVFLYIFMDILIYAHILLTDFHVDTISSVSIFHGKLASMAPMLWTVQQYRFGNRDQKLISNLSISFSWQRNNRTAFHRKCLRMRWIGPYNPIVSIQNLWNEYSCLCE